MYPPATQMLIIAVYSFSCDAICIINSMVSSVIWD